MSRHNILTSVGTVSGGEGLELHVTAASDWRPSIRDECASETEEGKGCKNHTP